ncbi:transcription termination factor NusA [Patescibacteria group bacterium]|nr:transcription termination factor NusA [Patescibacteria group bacterium]
MAVTEFKSALNQVATERGISVESVLESIKQALVSAYKKDYQEQHGEALAEDADITSELDPDTGEAKILQEGKDVTPAGFGRIAAQTAKQVILQKIRETEKENILKEYREKIGTIVSGLIFRTEGSLLVFDLGKAHGIMPPVERVSNEDYHINQRMKVLIKDIREGPKGTEIIVSRTDPQFIVKLFESEVPEITSGTVVIEEIAREAGSRTKLAVASKDEKVDPVGSCVGQKGVRVQAVIAELNGEKIDIVPFSTSTEKYIAAALSPAKVTDVQIINEEQKEAVVSVPEDQLSLAIGKEGQNVRLAFKLTKWKIDIKGAPSVFGLTQEEQAESDAKNKKGTVGIWDTDIKERKEALKKAEAEEAEESETENQAEPETPDNEEAREETPAM